MKKLVSFALALMTLTALSISTFAADVTSPAATEHEQHVAGDRVVEPYLSSTTVEINLKTSEWTELYTNDNWLDVRALVENNNGNPGSIYVLVEAMNNDGQVFEIGKSSLVTVGSSYRSPPISGGSYKQYTVWLKASSVAGKYSITYDDVSA